MRSFDPENDGGDDRPGHEPGDAVRQDVACPRCAYHPSRHDRWVCAPDGCGELWDTFTTAARCPRCDARFRWTVCPRCGVTSAHAEWYRRPTIAPGERV